MCSYCHLMTPSQKHGTSLLFLTAIQGKLVGRVYNQLHKASGLKTLPNILLQPYSLFFMFRLCQFLYVFACFGSQRCQFTPARRTNGPADAKPSSRVYVVMCHHGHRATKGAQLVWPIVSVRVWADCQKREKRTYGQSEQTESYPPSSSSHRSHSALPRRALSPLADPRCKHAAAGLSCHSIVLLSMKAAFSPWRPLGGACCCFPKQTYDLWSGLSHRYTD